MNLQTGGGNKSCRISECVLISVATTSRLPSTSSPRVQMSMEREAKSAQVGISASVSNTGRPKSRVTNRLAPTKWHSVFMLKITQLNDVGKPKHKANAPHRSRIRNEEETEYVLQQWLSTRKPQQTSMWAPRWLKKTKLAQKTHKIKVFLIVIDQLSWKTWVYEKAKCDF